MKKLAIAMMALTSLSLSAFAQSSSTSAASAAGSEATSTTTLTEQKPATADKKWSVGFVNEINTNMREQKEIASKVKYTSVNVLSAGYKVTELDKITVAGQFEFNRIPREQDRQDWNDGYTPLDPYLALTHSLKTGVLGSDPFSVMARYYFPIESSSHWSFKQAGYINGVFRIDSEIQWTISKMFAASVYFNPRLYFKPASETIGSIREYGYLYLNATESLQFYQNVGVLTNVESMTFGRKASERLSAETGVNYTVNKNVAFNFYVNSTVFTEGAPPAADNVSEGANRIYSDEKTDYGFVTSITF